MRVRRFAFTAALVAVLCAPLAPADAVPAATPPASASDGTGPLDTASDLAAALKFEERVLDHFHYAQPQSQIYNTVEKRTGDIETLIGEPDSGLYTAAYLSAESYRWALARSELRKRLRSEARAFWRAQLVDAKNRIDQMVRKYHLLVNIARGWSTRFDPKIDPSKEPIDGGYIDFGGGIFPAEGGLLFRVCFPTDAPAHLNIGKHLGPHGVVTTLPWEDGKRYDCVGNTSRDQYAGATNALATVLRLVGPHDAALRSMVAGDLLKLSNYAVKYLFLQPRPHGKVVIPEVGGNDLTGFISPLFIHTPLARMNMLQIGRYAAAVIGDHLTKLRLDALWQVEVATQLPQLAPSMVIDASQPHDTYYKFHLNHLTAENIILLEPNVVTRELMRLGLAAMDATTGDDGNALFEGMTYGLTGEKSRLDKAVKHHREWLAYRAHSERVGNIIDYSKSCGKHFACAPRESREMVMPVPGGKDVVVPLAGGGPLRAVSPVPVPYRRPADFIWQKDPTIITGCGGGVVPDCPKSRSARWEGDGTDFLMTYWMIRYYSEAAVPKLAPFPTWSGPYFR